MIAIALHFLSEVSKSKLQFPNLRLQVPDFRGVSIDLLFQSEELFDIFEEFAKHKRLRAAISAMIARVSA